jgi:hypothetical protein
MRKRLLISLLLLPLCGCAVLRYHHDETGTRFTAYSLFANDKLSKLVVERTNRASTQGLSLGEMSSDVDNAAIEAIVKGVVEGILQGMKLLP